MLDKVGSAVREFGWFAGLVYSMDRALLRISSSLRLYFYEIMIQPIADNPLVPQRFSKHLEIREIKRGDLEVDLMPARKEIKEQRFEQGAICLGAFQKGQFIGYIWFCFESYLEDEVRCTFLLTPPDSSTFDFDLYVFPEYRMGLAFIGIWNGANAFLRQRGVRFTYSRLTRFNVASRRAHQHLGWKLVGRTIFLSAWRAQFMVATLFPYVHVSLNARNRVRLRLRPDVLAAA